MRILALDQGTTSSRVLALSDGELTVTGQLRHTTTYPAPGWVEQDATELLANCQTLIAAAGLAGAIGIANQGESCLAWDAVTGEPLSPVIVWQDTRTRSALGQMAAQGMAPEVMARSGLPLDPYFSAAKLGWLAKQPGSAAALRQGRLRLGTTDAFFLDRLTGRFVTDPSTASRTGLLNLASGRWDDWLCDAFGVPRDCLPMIVPTVGDFGSIAGIPVMASLVDQQAALYGHGCTASGQAKITFGTGAFALAVTGRSVPDPVALQGLVPTIAWDLGDGPVYAVEGGVPDAAAAVEWAIRAGLADSLADFASFDARAAVDRGLVFLPCFSGLAAPHWDRTAAPLIIGLQPQMTLADMRQALLEGIAALSAALITALVAVADIKGAICVDGGLSANAYFTQMLSRLSGRRLLVSGMPERTAMGCIALAAFGSGAAPDLPTFAATKIDAEPAPAAWNQTFARALDRARDWSGHTQM